VTGCDGRISRVHYVLPRQKAANWVGPGRGRKTTRPGANGVGGHAARRDATGDCCDSCDKLPSHDTSRRQRPNSWLGWARSFLLPPGVWWRHPTLRRRPAGAGLLRTGGSQAGEGQMASHA